MRAAIVEAPCGPVRGEALRRPGIRVFRGIPYAAAPVGELRWRPPAPHPPWSSIRDARFFAPIAIQNPPPDTSLFADLREQQSEDCLYLNIWTPFDPPDKPLPVMVWLHVGAFQFGAGSSTLYNGTRWAQDGAVLVTLNFRLSKIGFLAHPDLVSEQNGSAGNYGLRDQIAALSWVHENIAAFGGDPNCVTICGVSSGASSIALLMTAPRARGLFHRAIAESGGAFGPTASTTGAGDAWQDLESACATGLKWAQEINAPRLRQLRQLGAGDLRTASVTPPSATSGVLDSARPIIDGDLLPASPHSVFSAGRQAPVPLLVGCAANEDLAMFNYPRDLETFQRHGHAEHGTRAAEYFSLYPALSDEDAVAVGLRSNGHRLFTWQNWRWANLHARSGHPTYYYRFEQPPPVPANKYVEQELPRPLGAFHGASLFYTFHSAKHAAHWRWTSADLEFGATIRSAWIHFARHGTPANERLPAWPAFNVDLPSIMILSSDRTIISPMLERAYLAFWDRHYSGSTGSMEKV